MNLLKRGQLYPHTLIKLAWLQKYSLMFLLIALEISPSKLDSKQQLNFNQRCKKEFRENIFKVLSLEGYVDTFVVDTNPDLQYRSTWSQSQYCC